MMFEETKGRFGFHLSGSEDNPFPVYSFIQFYVKSSSLSRTADLAISPHLMTGSEIDRFIDDAISALQEIRIDAKCALRAASDHTPIDLECDAR
jgi:hypothetical protein